jgi:hypothetical protein
MNIPLTFNIGDTVWIWRFGEIKSDTIKKIYIILEKDADDRIRYETSHYDTLTPDDENRFWFRSRQDVVNFVQKTVICAPATPCPEPPSEGLGTLKDKLLTVANVDTPKTELEIALKKLDTLEEEDEDLGLENCPQCGEEAWDGYICHSCGAKNI